MANINDKLTILYDVLVDDVKTFEDEIINLIAQPAQIEDTNRFASLLSSLKNPRFIGPLMLQISQGNKGDTWLTNYLYAVADLFGESSVEDEFDTPENLIAKLESWIIDNTGELAWMAAGMLKYHESEEAEKIRLKKLEERGDFFLTYVECLLGLLRFNKPKYMELVKQIATDETRDIKLREFCDDLINNSKSKA